MTTPDPKTFSVLDAIQGRSYPTDEITLYTDAASMYLLNRLEVEQANLTDGDAANELEPKREELKAAIKATALTFHLRGFSTGVIQSINDEARAKFGEDVSLDKEEPFVWRMDKYVAESIISVTNAEGAVDESRWGVEDAAKLRAHLPDDEWNRLQTAVLALSFASWQFDQAVNADFS